MELQIVTIESIQLVFDVLLESVDVVHVGQDLDELTEILQLLRFNLLRHLSSQLHQLIVMPLNTQLMFLKLGCMLILELDAFAFVLLHLMLLG